MKQGFTLLIILLTFNLIAQKNDSLIVQEQNIAEKMLHNDGKLVIGGYGEVHYNQSLENGVGHNGKLDVHRMVLLTGYKFNNRTRFITEIEFEHVKEVYVEQAFLQYKINSFMNFRAGLMLIPMGIVNEYHEPTAFFGVERPLVDKYIVPSTWREIGLGISGNIIQSSIKYQLYLINGLNGYNGQGLFNAKNGLRSGRQKGAESYISSPALTGKVEYYGFPSLRLGLSAYYGNSQSTMFDGIEKGNDEMIASADSSVVGVTMLGLDARFNKNGWKSTGQFYYTMISNAESYNAFTGEGSTLNNLGNSMMGYYVDLAYDVFHSNSGIKTSLYPFIRFQQYDTHFSVNESIEKNDDYHNSIITTGLSWYLAKGAVLKADVQFRKAKTDDAFKATFNAGFGIMF